MPDFADDTEGTEAPRVTLPDLDASPEFVGTTACFRGFGFAPRPSHPVFGDVPMGWAVIGDTMVQVSRIDRVSSNGTVGVTVWFCNDSAEVLKTPPAEVSRLIAEAQRG